MHTLCLEKLGLGVKYRDFSGKKLVWRKQPPFPWKKMVLGRKTNFFLGKTKKTIFWDTMRPDTKNVVFLVFPKKNGFGQENQPFPRQKMVWAWKTNFFIRKKMVLGRKTNFFLGKTKKTIFWDTMRPDKKNCFLEKDGFSRQNHFSPRKSWFFTPKPSFS